ncbi:transposase [Streptomyces sp. NPDC059256]|uniref:transposase n=1 Tax=Streptomyces sp. NPDC059256 TaxID=3346794 RepID=UPI00368CA75F
MAEGSAFWEWAALESSPREEGLDLLIWCTSGSCRRFFTARQPSQAVSPARTIEVSFSLCRRPGHASLHRPRRCLMPLVWNGGSAPFRAGVPVMVRRHELTNPQCECIASLLPEIGGPGGRWADHRTTVNGVFYRTRTGIPWRDLPERYGSWQTVYERHRRRSADGTWLKILRALQAGAGATASDVDGSWAVNTDSTTCRAHQHAAGARHDPPTDHPEKGAEPVWTQRGARPWDALGAD